MRETTVSGVIVVTGSRDAKELGRNTDIVGYFIQRRAMAFTKRYMSLKPTVLFHGGCRGVDKIAETQAKMIGINRRSFAITKEQWKEQGPSAGPRRNRRMLEEALARCNDPVLLAFPVRGLPCKGTKSCIDIAFELGIETRIYFLGAE